MKIDFVSQRVSQHNMQSMFPYYMGQKKIRENFVTKCIDKLVALFLYSRWFITHNRWPHNNELPLYFCKKLYVEFHLGLDVDYTSIPSYVG
jgi:uncharacterized membrane protein